MIYLGELNLLHAYRQTDNGIYLVDEEENLNLRLDFGLGNEKLNYYFKIAESF